MKENKNTCDYIGCNNPATCVVEANDGSNNKYPACDEHKAEMKSIIAQGISLKTS